MRARHRSHRSQRSTKSDRDVGLGSAHKSQVWSQRGRGFDRRLRARRYQSARPRCSHPIERLQRAQRITRRACAALQRIEISSETRVTGVHPSADRRPACARLDPKAQRVPPVIARLPKGHTKPSVSALASRWVNGGGGTRCMRTHAPCVRGRMVNSVSEQVRVPTSSGRSDSSI